MALSDDASQAVRTRVATPIGDVWIMAEGDAVTALGWGPASALAEETVATGVAAQAADELVGYFDGRLTAFSVPLAPQVSPLTAKVLAEMRKIPFGETRTYGDLARAVGAPPQVVGQACGANPIPILIPCHRVLSANGLGGFSGHGGVETKVALLKHEGAASLLL